MSQSQFLGLATPDLMSPSPVPQPQSQLLLWSYIAWSSVFRARVRLYWTPGCALSVGVLGALWSIELCVECPLTFSHAWPFETVLSLDVF